VAEHGGSIHVEDNLPLGSRFLIELPVAELTPASLADHNGSDAIDELLDLISRRGRRGWHS